MKKYLIIPAMPTPNGPLHLGHIGGPYLRADILARHLRQQGNHVSMFSGTDNYENYALRQANKELKPPLEICNTYHAQITADLNTMNIKFDDFINPHAAQWHEKYRAWCFKLLDDAEKAGKIAGKDDDLFLTLPSESALQNKGINHALTNSYQRFLLATKQQNILTTNCDWGIRYNTEKTLLSYGFIYAYYLLLGEYASGHNSNAMATENDTTIIATFGVDNTHPVLASVLGFSAINSNYKAVDFYLINYFYYLDGKKFSTSKRHGIWVNDIRDMAISIDILRLYLASIDISRAPGNFSLDAFFLFQTMLTRKLSAFVKAPLAAVTAAQQTNKEFLAQINQVLQPGNFRPDIAVAAILDWLQLGEQLKIDTEEYTVWLKTLGAAVYSFMPELSQRIHRMLEEQKICVNMT